MKAEAKKAENGEWLGIVNDKTSKVLYQTATTSFTRIDALNRAQRWIREQRIDKAARAENTLKRVRRHYKKKPKPIPAEESGAEVVSTPKGAGVVVRRSKYIVEVKIRGAVECFMPAMVKTI